MPPKTITDKTIIQVNLKTLVVIIVFIVSSFATMYWRLSSTMDSGFINFQQQVTGISNQVNRVDGKVQGLVLSLNQNNRENTQPTNNPVQNQVPDKIK